MTDFPYREVAQRMREQTPMPSPDETVHSYYSGVAIYAIIWALEDLADD